MKKTFALVVVLIACLMLSGCTVKHLSLEQSQKNFEYYETQLQELLEPYGLTITESPTDDINDPPTEEQIYGWYRSFLIEIDDTATITVDFSSNATWKEKGREDFYVFYRSNGENEFDVKLFTEIVNAVSGREIDEDYCAQFLSDPEEAHSPSRYALSKSDGQKIYKYEFLNFQQDWSIGYTLDEDGVEELRFWGLTKQLKG